MTSSGTFIHIQLPGSTEIVTCARYELERTESGRPLGRLVYGRMYLERRDAVPLDPFHLPLSPREYVTAKLGGLFGALRDAAPDAWGRRVIERRRGTVDLTELDYLVHPARARIGALEFGSVAGVPVSGGIEPSGVSDVALVREAAARIEADEPTDESLEALLDPGSSMGGARPKAVLRDESGLWLAKFPQRGDRWSNTAVEGGMLRLAEECGIRTPESRLVRVGDEQVLLVRRFDRESAPVGRGEYRYRMLSALTVLDLDEEVVDRSGWSYLALADELQRWSEDPLADKRELFRRVVFNALISNTDDHPRNHALIAPRRGWRLSPAYDLTPSRARSLERRDLAMTLGLEGRIATRANLLSASPRFGLAREEANSVIDSLVDLVRHGWRRAVLNHGGSAADCEAVAPAFIYPGFEQGELR